MSFVISVRGRFSVIESLEKVMACELRQACHILPMTGLVKIGANDGSIT